MIQSKPTLLIAKNSRIFGRTSPPPLSTSIFFGRDRGMVFFLTFLILTTVFIPMIDLSQPVRVGLSFFFVVTLISGAFATIHHRILICLVVVLAVLTLPWIWSVNPPSAQFTGIGERLKLACLSILVFMTLKRTLRPGPVTSYRVMGGIAGYLLIGFTWTFDTNWSYSRRPTRFTSASGVTGIASRQPSHLIYFSFITLTTLGYGDAYPVHPVARSRLAVAEALVGQLFSLAILISSLVEDGVADQVSQWSRQTRTFWASPAACGKNAKTPTPLTVAARRALPTGNPSEP